LKVRNRNFFKMKNLFIGLMLLTASFSFANSEVEVKTLELIIPPTTTVVVKSETNKSTADDKKDVCYCSQGSCGCGPTLKDAKEAYELAVQSGH
jgi:hypothetical protein